MLLEKKGKKKKINLGLFLNLLNAFNRKERIKKDQSSTPVTSELKSLRGRTD